MVVSLPRSEPTIQDVIALGPTVHQLLQPINEDIPLYLHLACGADAIAVLDGGLPSSAPDIERLIAESGQGLPVRYACNSHPHHDHIGCYGLLREKYDALVVAAEDARAWIVDPERNLTEFALHHPHIIGPSRDLLADLEPTFAAGCPVDVLVQDSVVLDLGGGVELESFRVDGHLHAELAWFERSSRTLVLGDVVTATAWPIFHGHVDPDALRASLDRLVAFVREHEVDTIAMSHYPARDAAAFAELVKQVRADVDRTRSLVVAALAGGERDLRTVWTEVCAAAGKSPEFRALAMVEAHLSELVADGSARLVGPETYVLTPSRRKNQ
jgi:glyoxylase-like metal-dependent hydrolase (beta-lactamase superfamily II)